MLAYVCGLDGLRTWHWRVAFWLGIGYLLLLALLPAAGVWPMRFSLTFVMRGMVWEPRNVPFLLVHSVPPALACLNVLPVIGCALAARGRSPRQPLLLYVAVQAPLLAVVLAVAGYVAWHGRFSFSGGTVHVLPRAFATAAAASVLLSLPLLLLLVLRMRPAGLARDWQG